METPSPFGLPPGNPVRSHGPGGYANYQEFKDWLRDEFAFRCVYCLEREEWYPSRSAAFAVEHVLSQSLYPELVCVYDNLVYSCSRCNSRKASEECIDPSAVALGRHVRFRADGTAEGITSLGIEHVEGFRLNEPPALRVRQHYLRLVELERRLPADAAIDAMFREAFGYPDDLPDLGAKRPPSNSRPEGVKACHFRRRAEGILPETY